MQADIIKIGNSQGIRIPKPVLEQCGFGPTVEMTVEDGKLVISTARDPRSGWDDQFRAMAARGDDEPNLADLTLTDWDATEWQW